MQEVWYCYHFGKQQKSVPRRRPLSPPHKSIVYIASTTKHHREYYTVRDYTSSIEEKKRSAREAAENRSSSIIILLLPQLLLPSTSTLLQHQIAFLLLPPSPNFLIAENAHRVILNSHEKLPNSPKVVGFLGFLKWPKSHIKSHENDQNPTKIPPI